jgi:hypothetical protein
MLTRKEKMDSQSLHPFLRPFAAIWYCLFVVTAPMTFVNYLREVDLAVEVKFFLGLIAGVWPWYAASFMRSFARKFLS